MKRKFKIMYPENHWDKDKAGKPYMPPAGCFVVMNGGGVFFLVDTGKETYCPSVRKLSDVLQFGYDVIWKN